MTRNTDSTWGDDANERAIPTIPAQRTATEALSDATRHAWVAHFADAPAPTAAQMLDEAEHIDPDLADEMAATRWHLLIGGVTRPGKASAGQYGSAA